MAEVVLESLFKVFSSVHGGVDRSAPAGEGPPAAVRDVSLRIASGEFVVLVGPSGCGKSTLLRIIAGLESPTSGTVSIAGRVVNEVAPKDRDVAMVFQNYALYPHMTVGENMSFAMKMRGVERAERDRKVIEAARALEIDGLLSRRPGELSGGQRQRVALGRAMVREPKVFLFDEPLSNLDARLRVSTRAEIKALHQRLRITTVYVTHDQEEAMTLGDRVAVMDGGVIRQCDTPRVVYDAPADRMVAGFVGTPAMNMLMGDAGADGAIVVGGVVVAHRVGASGSVVVGVRPTALRVLAHGTGDWEGEVLVVEPLGEQTDVHVKLPFGARVVARTDGVVDLRAGMRVGVSIDRARAHVFDGASGKASFVEGKR